MHIPEELLTICREHSIQKRAPGEPILYQGEVPRHAYILTEGIAKIYDIGGAGDEKIVNFLSVGDLLPPAWVFKKAPVSLYYYDAFTPCSYYRIPRDTLLAAIQNTPAITYFMFEHYATSFVGSLLEINALEQSKGSEKIIHMLQYLLMRFPSNRGQGKDWQRIDLRITHQDLANMTGLTRETTSTELNKLRRKKIVEYSNQHYSLNIPLLRSLLSSEEFLSFKLQ
ncbi:MAG: Crp/Fnr family transcriptional regulator [Candidatus Saccharimonadales bacterium]